MKNFTRYLLSLSLCLTLLGGFSFQAIATPNSLETIQLIAHETEVDSPDNGSVSIRNVECRITSTSSWKLETTKILLLLVDWIWRGDLAIPPPLFIPLKEEAWNSFFRSLLQEAVSYNLFLTIEEQLN